MVDAVEIEDDEGGHRGEGEENAFAALCKNLPMIDMDMNDIEDKAKFIADCKACGGENIASIVDTMTNVGAGSKEAR